jgi:glycerophosphoryl diester phosphodiesterase
MRYIAHRGYSEEYRDNSINAILWAINLGYDGIEIDVQLCGTGELILYHDVYIDDYFISETSFEVLKKFGICSLQEVYDKLPQIINMELILDIKGNNIEVIGALENFYTRRPTELVSFCSFNRRILKILPGCYKKGSTFETTFHPREYDMITRNLSMVVIHWTCLDHEFITYCKSKNIRVYTYTHKEPKELEYMYKYDVDAIITNGIVIQIVSTHQSSVQNLPSNLQHLSTEQLTFACLPGLRGTRSYWN